MLDDLEQKEAETLCPNCLWQVSREDAICGGCGRPLVIPCPKCGEQTFVLDRCQVCGENLTVTCSNHRCRKPVFYQNAHCRACGTKVG